MGHLTLEQRYEIAASLQMGKSQSEIAAQLGRCKSVISREIRRNRDGRSGEYKASLANRKTSQRHRNKKKRLDFTPEVKQRVKDCLAKQYSPEQIKGRANLEGKKMVSVERIYQYVWADKKAGGQLYKQLRHRGKKYQRRSSNKGRRGIIADKTCISQRPSIVDKKERLGDLEIDLIVGKNHQKALLTINDRATGMLFMTKVESKKAAVIEAKSIELLQDWKPLIHTITSDNGKEFANHKKIAAALHIDFYFALPYHSWQRGANENLNGLVRQYFPKQLSFDSITPQQIDAVVERLNNRPRKRFNFSTPIEVFANKIDQIDPVAFIY